MACPYLTEVIMVLCRATSVRKPVPGDRLAAASRCDGEQFLGCPLYREAGARAGRSLEEAEAELAAHPVTPRGRSS